MCKSDIESLYLMKRNAFKLMAVAALVFGLAAMTSCGGRGNKSGKTAENDGGQVAEAVVKEQAKAPEKQAAPKAPAKKWYEQDFSLTYKQYVLGNSATRSYARKGNVIACNIEGSRNQKLYVFTDSTRTEYSLNTANGQFVKGREKSDFAIMNDGVRMLLKDQLGDNVFMDILKPDGKNCTARDTTIFGRPTYVIVQEKTENSFGVDTYTKITEWVDKENNLPYYKYGIGKAGDKVIADGKVFEITEFSATPTYEGFIISLDGLTEIAK